MLPNQQVSALSEEYGMLETELCFLSYLKYFFLNISRLLDHVIPIFTSGFACFQLFSV